MLYLVSASKIFEEGAIGSRSRNQCNGSLWNVLGNRKRRQLLPWSRNKIQRIWPSILAMVLKQRRLRPNVIHR